jgi:Protein of unknown function (DUF3570)
VAATDVVHKVAGLLGGLLGGLLTASGARAVELPENRAEAMFHVYDGGGVRATGPALLVRKSLADRVSLSAQYYVDSVSNASIDVVTTASPFKEKRTAYDFGVDYVVRDTTLTLGINKSREPDYDVNGASVDVSQEVFGGMTTVSMGYSRSLDQVRKQGAPEFADSAKHWQYRFGLTQILTPRWLASANAEVVSDDGYLGSPYRAARVFGAAVPERNPRTRTSRAIKLRAIGEVAERNTVRGEYRYFWDTWGIKAHTVEAGYSRYFGQPWLADAFVRFNTQDGALFYSDNAQAETLYVSRNRQLGTFKSFGVGAKLTYLAKQVPGQYELRLTGGYEWMRFKYADFTDVRTGQAYNFGAHVLQLTASTTF